MAAEVVCIGDSLTNGGYPDVLQELLNTSEPSCRWNVQSWANVGSDTRDWLKFLANNAIQRYPADIYVLMLGTNDCQVASRGTFRGFTEEGYRDRLTQIARIVMRSGSPVIIVTPPPVDVGTFAGLIDRDLVNTILPRICPQVAAALGCDSGDAFTALGGAAPKHQAFVDGVHLSPEGNILVAQAVMGPVIRTVLNTSCGNLPTRPRRPSGGVEDKVALAAVMSPQLAVLAAAPMAAVMSPQKGPMPLPMSPTHVGGAPVVTRSQADGGYHIGAAVEVWSKSWDQWFTGRVTELNGTSVLAEFVAPDGKDKEKWMPIGHQHLRLLALSHQVTLISPRLQALNFGALSSVVDGYPVDQLDNGNALNGNATAIASVNGISVKPGPVIASPMKGEAFIVNPGPVMVIGDRLPISQSRAATGAASVKMPPPLGQRSPGFANGEFVEYQSKTDKQWYRGTVKSTDATGYLLMLDIGILKTISFQESSSRLRPAGTGNTVAGVVSRNPGGYQAIHRTRTA